MTEETKKKINGWAGWSTAVVGIPSAVLVTLALTAGEYRARFESLESCSQTTIVEMKDHERRISEIEGVVRYDLPHIRQTLERIERKLM